MDKLLKYKIIFKTIVTLLLQEIKINAKSTHAKLTMFKVYQRGRAKRKPIEKETYRIDFGSNDRFCSCTCLSFRRKRVLCKHFFLIIENGYRSFTDVSQVYRSHPFIILDEELFQGMNDSLNFEDLKTLDWNGVSSHKEEKKILGKFYLSKKRNIECLFIGKVWVMLTFAIR